MQGNENQNTQEANALGLLGRAAYWLIRYRFPVLTAYVVLAALALVPSWQLTFDRSVEGLFDKDDPRLASYLEDKQLFGGIEKAIVAYTDAELLTTEGLNRLEQFGSTLIQIDGVRGVVSLTQAKLPGAPLSSLTLSEHLERGKLTPHVLREKLIASDMYRGRIISEDGRTTVLFVSLSPAGEGESSRAQTVKQIRAVCEANKPQAVVAGAPVIVEEIFRHLEMDGRTLGLISSLVLALVIGFLFQNLRWLILPLGVVHLTLVWTKAMLVFSGMQLSMVSSPLVALVTVIGVATVVHVTIRYREERAMHSPETAMRQTIIHIGPAIFWTCMTTAAGFMALLASRVVPVAGFGTMMALGSFLVFITTLGLLPGIILMGRHSDPSETPGGKKVTSALNGIVSIVERRPARVALSGLVLLLLTGLGVFRLEVATDFDDNFRQSNPIVKSYRFLADRMGATSMFDVLIDGPASDNEHEVSEFLERVRSLQHTLNNQAGVAGTLSAVNVLDFALDTKAEFSSTAELVQAGLLHAMPPAKRLELFQALQPDLMSGFWNREQNVARIIVQTKALKGAGAKRQIIEDVEALSRDEFPQSRVAGVDILLSFMVKSLLADQWVTFSLAAAAILILMMIAFRDWRLGLIALVPNIAPIVIVLGVMGWAGLHVNTATAMLASVSMGLAVDFSIHYLYRFRQERRSGKSVGDAARSAHGSVGLAMVLSNFALIAGFSTLAISAFVPTIHFGILVSVAMVGGLVGNLTVLPLLLRVIYR